VHLVSALAVELGQSAPKSVRTGRTRRAYRNWFDSLAGRRQGRKIGHPRVRRKHGRQSIRPTRNGFTLRGDRLYVAKVGEPRVRWSRDLPSVPSSVTVIREPDGRDHVSFVVEVAETPLPVSRVDGNHRSTRLCSACGVVGEAKPLAVRKWTCECGVVHDRDGNAARNILAAGRAERLNACGGDVRPGPVSAVPGEAGTHRGGA
jgi:transposase